MTLQEMLGTALPLLQAPMAGVQGSALAVAVCEAGGLGALPFFTAFDALGCHQRHGAGQARFFRRVAAAAAIEVHLHIHHGDDGAFHQPHLGAAGLRPVLDGQQRPGRWSIKNGSSASA